MASKGNVNISEISLASTSDKSGDDGGAPPRKKSRRSNCDLDTMQDSNGCIQNGTPSSSNNIAIVTENGHLDVSNGSGSGDGMQLDRTKQEIVRLIGQYLKNEGLT